MNELFNLDGRVIVLTGGAGLLGRRYAQALVNAGARAVVADVRQEAAQEVVDELALSGTDLIMAHGVDITSPEDVARMVEAVMKKWGRIDGLVNNAAIDPKFDVEQSEQRKQRFEDYPLDLWKKSLDVNLTGCFLCCQAVGRVMVDQGSGAIVNIASTYGLVAPNQSLYLEEGETEPSRIKPPDYPVTKAGVAQLTRYLASYWGRKGIRVNTLSPGGVQSQQDAGFVARYASMTPMGRMARQDEMSGALIFLLSDASSYMTGANLVVDGGWTAW